MLDRNWTKWLNRSQFIQFAICIPRIFEQHRLQLHITLILRFRRMPPTIWEMGGRFYASSSLFPSKYVASKSH